MWENKKLTECEICGMKFLLNKKDIYMVKKATSLSNALIGGGDIFDAIDCPTCGTQILLKIRLPKLQTDDVVEEQI